MNHQQEHSTHVIPITIYFAVFLTLLVLTGVTVWASFQNFGDLSTLIAVTIAVIKGTLVVLYFMHLRYSDRLTWVVVIAGFVWLGIMIGITVSDYYSRDWIPGF